MTDGPFICYRELLPCSSITRSVFFRSFDPKVGAHDEYLCTLQLNSIRIYKVCDSSVVSDDEKFLSLKYCKKLFGKPNGVVVFYDAQTKSDVLVLSIDAGKVVVLRCNVLSNQFETILLCNSEENAFGTGAELQVQSKGAKRFLGLGVDCTINVCKENRVICSTIYGQHLVIVPVPTLGSQSSTAGTDDKFNDSSTQGDAEQQQYQPIFAVDINATHGLAGPIIDTCFLTGYSKPVIAVLQQSGLMHIGHAARVRHCVTLTALAVNVESKTLSVLWQRTHLPHDCIRLLHISNPAYAGCVCVIALSAVIMVNQEEATGLAVNGFAAVTVDTPNSLNSRRVQYLGTKVGVKSGNIALQSWAAQEEGIELDASHWIEDCSGATSVAGRNNQNSIVGTLKDGTILRVTMALSTPHMLSSVLFTPEVVASSVRASCFSKSFAGDLWFLGSRQSSALLIKVHHKTSAKDHWYHQRKGSKHRMVENTASSFLSPAVKRLRASSIVSAEGNDVLSSGLTNGASVGSPLASSSAQTLYSESKNGAAAKSSHRGGDGEGSDYEDAEAEELALYGNALHEEDMDGMEPYRVPLLRATSNGSVTTRSTGFCSELVLTVVDSVAVLGPMLHGLHTKHDSMFETVDSISWERQGETDTKAAIQATAASYIAERETRDGFLLSSGLDEDGSILKVFHGLHMTKLATRNLPGATRVFSLSSAPDSAYGALLVVYENKTRMLHFTEQAKEIRFKEIPAADSGLICTSPTLNFGLVVSGAESMVVHIVPQGLRLARLNAAYGEEAEALQDVLVADSLEFGGLGGEVGETVLSGDFCAGYAVMLTSLHRLHVLRYDVTEDSMEVLCSASGTAGASTVSAAMEVTEGDANAAVPTFLDGIFSSEIVSVSLYFGVLDVDSTQPPTVSQDSVEGLVGADVVVSVGTAEGKVERSSRLHQLLEEIYLYGAALPCETGSNSSATGEEEPIGVSSSSASADERAKPSETDKTKTKTRGAAGEAGVQSGAPDLSSQAFLIVTEVNGTLSIVRLSNMRCVFQSSKFASLAESVSVPEPLRAGSTEADQPSVPEGLIVETKLMRLSTDELHFDDPVRSTLCLALLLSTGDLITYTAAENSTGVVHAFHKIDQCPVVNKRAADATKLVRSTSMDGTATLPDASGESGISTHHGAYLSSTEYTSRGGPWLSALSIVAGGRSGILVSGNDTVIITSVQGLPTVLPLGMPEVPCINYGHHSLVPFQVGGTNAVAALWFECEDIETLKNHQVASAATTAATGTITNRAATLGIYQQVEGLELFPGGVLSVKRVAVGKTTHRVAEIQNRTDDRTQQALLEKKTFLLACSEELKQPFLPSVLTEAELQEDSELYERYLTSLESFCQPDLSVGQAPPILQRQHTLALLQGTSVVDTYPLPANECILDTEVLYLTMEKYITPPGQLMAMKFTEKRVFVAACTAIVEKRGEDTQGNGRLLLYAIDYALFEGDAEEDSAPKPETASSSATTNATEAMDVADDAAAETNANGNSNGNGSLQNASNGQGKEADNKDLSSAQAKFLGAIKPKLRLVWSGPGPASVVKQLGEYVLSTVASTVYVYKFNSSLMELEQVSFFFAQVRSVSVFSSVPVFTSIFLHLNTPANSAM